MLFTRARTRWRHDNKYRASGIYGFSSLSFVMQIRDDLKNGLILGPESNRRPMATETNRNVRHEGGMIIALKA